MDFEDLLERAIEVFDDEHAVAEFRERYAAFTVDEYQDVNLLQQTLLERWLGPRDDLCVVGDDYQSIYGFTGATPEYLLGCRRPLPGREVIRLEENYRSTPQVLELANRLVPKLGGAEKMLRAVRPDGPEPEVRPFATAEAEDAHLVERIRGAGCPLEEIAILCRTNARLADFEETLARGGHPVAGRGAAHARGRAAAAARARRRGAGGRARAGDRARPGLVAEPPPDEKIGEREETRQNDLARLVRLAEEVGGTGAEFHAELERRFGDGGEARRGVHLLTYHGAKGLEFEVVLLPRLEEKELPSKQAEDRCRDRRRAAAVLRRADAREACARGHVGGQAEPVPRRADAGRCGGAPKPSRRQASRR